MSMEHNQSVVEQQVQPESDTEMKINNNCHFAHSYHHYPPPSISSASGIYKVRFLRGMDYRYSRYMIPKSWRNLLFMHGKLTFESTYKSLGSSWIKTDFTKTATNANITFMNELEDWIFAYLKENNNNNDNNQNNNNGNDNNDDSTSQQIWNFVQSHKEPTKSMYKVGDWVRVLSEIDGIVDSESWGIVKSLKTFKKEYDWPGNLYHYCNTQVEFIDTKLDRQSQFIALTLPGQQQPLTKWVPSQDCELLEIDNNDTHLVKFLLLKQQIYKEKVSFLEMRLQAIESTFKDTWQQPIQSIIDMLHNTFAHNESAKPRIMRCVVFGVNCFELGLKKECEKYKLYWNEKGNTSKISLTEDEFKKVTNEEIPFKLIHCNYRTLSSGQLYIYSNIELKFVNYTIPRLYFIGKQNMINIPLNEQWRQLAMSGPQGLGTVIQQQQQVETQACFVTDLRKQLCV